MLHIFIGIASCDICRVGRDKRRDRPVSLLEAEHRECWLPESSYYFVREVDYPMPVLLC